MSKLVQKTLKKNKIELQEYKIVKPAYRERKYPKYTYTIFTVILSVFLLDIFTTIDLNINGFYIYLAFTLLVLYPLATRQDDPNEFLLITPELLLKVDKTNGLVSISYESIKNFRNNGESIDIVNGRDLISLSKKLYEDVFEVITDILEAKGKTFDKSKDYMIRDIIIRIVDNEIILDEVEEEETTTEKLTKQFFNHYEHLTPGYIDEIIPRNSNVRDVKIFDEHLSIKFEKFTVKGNHPENTTFENIQAFDCIFIFESAGIVEYSVKEGMEKNVPYIAKEVTLTALTEDLKDSIVTEWKYGRNSIILIFKSGIGNVKLSLNFKEVIVGWKKAR